MAELILDTSLDLGMVALGEKGQLIDSVTFPASFAASKRLLSSCLELLAKHGLTPKDITAIGAGVGPGSYTGIRVSVAFAKGMALALKIPLVGISTLRSLLPLEKIAGPVLLAIDAKIGGVYTILADDGVFLTQEELLSEEEFLALIRKYQPTIFTPTLRAIQARLPSQIEVHERYLAPQVTVNLLQLALMEKNYSLDGVLPLLYLRKTQAEINIQATEV
jgi:tRNA threonylcarbamoyladenosine biosynthesis protein TsaB